MKIRMVEQYVVKVNFRTTGWGQYGCPVSDLADIGGVVASMSRYAPNAEYVIERQRITTRTEVIEWKPSVG